MAWFPGLVTAEPSRPGYPTLSAVLGPGGELPLPVGDRTSYRLTASGPPADPPAIVTVVFGQTGAGSGEIVFENPPPAFGLTNNGEFSFYVDGVLLPPGDVDDLEPGQYPVSAKLGAGSTFYFWFVTGAGSLSNPAASKTVLTMPASDISLSASQITPLGPLYAVGGNSFGGAVTFNTNYNPLINRWRSAGGLLHTQSGNTAGFVGSKMYAAGGDIQDSLEAYDPSTNTWSMKATAPQDLYYTGGGVLSAEFIVNLGVYMGSTLKYNPTGNTWASKGGPGYGRRSPAAATADSKMYLVDGGSVNYSVFYKTNAAFDGVTNTWSARASDLVARGAPEVAASAGEVYVVGGLVTDAPVATAELTRYTTSANTWASRAAAPKKTSGPGGGIYSKRMYVCGGYNSASGWIGANQVYDLSANTWSARASGVYRRWFGAAVQ